MTNTEHKSKGVVILNRNILYQPLHYRDAAQNVVDCLRLISPGLRTEIASDAERAVDLITAGGIGALMVEPYSHGVFTPNSPERRDFEATRDLMERLSRKCFPVIAFTTQDPLELMSSYLQIFPGVHYTHHVPNTADIEKVLLPLLKRHL